jgi:hypothetical protein
VLHAPQGVSACCNSKPTGDGLKLALPSECSVCEHSSDSGSRVVPASQPPQCNCIHCAAEAASRWLQQRRSGSEPRSEHVTLACDVVALGHFPFPLPATTSQKVGEVAGGLSPRMYDRTVTLMLVILLTRIQQACADISVSFQTYQFQRCALTEALGLQK